MLGSLRYMHIHHQMYEPLVLSAVPLDETVNPVVLTEVTKGCDATESDEVVPLPAPIMHPPGVLETVPAKLTVNTVDPVAVPLVVETDILPALFVEPLYTEHVGLDVPAPEPHAAVGAALVL